MILGSALKYVFDIDNSLCSVPLPHFIRSFTQLKPNGNNGFLITQGLQQRNQVFLTTEQSL